MLKFSTDWKKAISGAGADGRVEMRHDDAAHHLGVVCAEVERRFLQALVEALQPRQHQEHDDRPR